MHTIVYVTLSDRGDCLSDADLMDRNSKMTDPMRDSGGQMEGGCGSVSPRVVRCRSVQNLHQTKEDWLRLAQAAQNLRSDEAPFSIASRFLETPHGEGGGGRGGGTGRGGTGGGGIQGGGGGLVLGEMEDSVSDR